MVWVIVVRKGKERKGKERKGKEITSLTSAKGPTT
jgi:hypothetical protein